MSDELLVGDRVQYWAGPHEGPPTGEATVISGQVRMGGTETHRIRKATGGTDYIAVTHLERAPADPPAALTALATAWHSAWNGTVMQHRDDTVADARSDLTVAEHLLAALLALPASERDALAAALAPAAPVQEAGHE